MQFTGRTVNGESVFINKWLSVILFKVYMSLKPMAF